jgi:cytochrome c biogenesis protein CcmG/thiol:disulfide interchange protein DsbE
MRLNLVLLLVSVLGACLLTFLLDQEYPPLPNSPAEQQQPAPPEFQIAPDITFKTLDGKTASLASFQGTPVILHFWASWCAPCVAEFPSLLTMAQKNQKKVIILAISTDRSPEKIKNFLKKQATPPPANMMVIWDEHKILTEDVFQTFKLPETIILDREGRMIRKEAGQTDWLSPDLKTLLDSLSAK